MITPEQADEIILANTDTKEMPGYRAISMAELRKEYGLFIDRHNLHMPMVQYLGMMLDVVRAMTRYKGVHTSSLPLDAWVYQEIIWERRPNIIIEIGNESGGSTMMLRDMLFGSDIQDAKYVIGIDITRERMPERAKTWPDIKWIDGNACDDGVVNQVKGLISDTDRVMVIDDSSHEYENTMTVLDNFCSLVTKDQYFIVEDTLIGKFVPFGTARERAHDAVLRWMDGREDFVIDRNREKWFITLNPDGFLVKIR